VRRVDEFGIQPLDPDDGRPRSVGEILGKMDPSELLRMADAVRELEQAPGWRFLAALMRADHAKSVFQMTEGHLSGIEAYAHSAGFIKGQRRALTIHDHVLKTAAEVASAERATTTGEES
jgi:hypothetical protein